MRAAQYQGLGSVTRRDVGYDTPARTPADHGASELPCNTCTPEQRQRCAAGPLECDDFILYCMSPRERQQTLDAGRQPGRTPMTQAEIRADIVRRQAAGRANLRRGKA